MDYERIIHSLIDPIVEEPESVLIRISEGSTSKDVVIIIASEKDDTARLIGKKGSIATALREMMSIVGKTDNKRIHLKFESFDEEGKVEE